MMMIFERVDGLLVEVPRHQSDEARKGRRVSRVFLGEVDVLWTPEEEAARTAEEAAEAERRRKDAEAVVLKLETVAKHRAEAAAKLTALGLSSEELAALLS